MSNLKSSGNRSASAWKIRIVGHDEVPPESLINHPLNFRIHTGLQAKTLSGAIHEIGFISSVTVNKRTGRIINGHLRVSLAIKQRQPTIPVEYVDLSEAEEAEALATYDPIGALATTDEAIYAKLLESVNTNDVALKMLFTDIVGDQANAAINSNLMLTNEQETGNSVILPYNMPVSPDYIEFGGYSLPMTKEENENFIRVFENYKEINKTESGFIAWLLTHVTV